MQTGLDRWTAFQNFAPALPTMHCGHWVTSLEAVCQIPAASSGSTKGFIQLFSPHKQIVLSTCKHTLICKKWWNNPLRTPPLWSYLLGNHHDIITCDDSKRTEINSVYFSHDLVFTSFVLWAVEWVHFGVTIFSEIQWSSFAPFLTHGAEVCRVTWHTFGRNFRATTNARPSSRKGATRLAAANVRFAPLLAPRPERTASCIWMNAGLRRLWSD